MPRVIIDAPPSRLAYLRRLRAERRAREAEQRKQRLRQWATPGVLAAAIDSTTVQTPALDVIDEAAEPAHLQGVVELLEEPMPETERVVHAAVAGVEPIGRALVAHHDVL